jgi:alanyl aminopeptidase
MGISPPIARPLAIASVMALVATLAWQPKSGSPPDAGDAPTLRLPDTAKPIRYRASLEIDPAARTFHGHVEIDVSVRRATDVLWLNGQDLTIARATLLRDGAAGTALAVTTLPRNFIALRGEVPPGDATLVIDYTGVQDVGRFAGMRRSPDAGDDYVVTHFEPIGARRVFPSFDEPAFKVPWQLELTVPAGNAAFTNTAVESERALPDGRTRVRFRPTAPLPSYLIALAVGPFDTVDAGSSRAGVAMRIVVPRGRGGDARYAAGEVGKVLAALEDYTGVPYPYDKLDHIVVPGSASDGAMEHPGLITYGPQFLLIPDSESAAARHHHVGIVTHELAHQWFGNLVTTAWWDDLWLNEAFATWLTPKAIEASHPAMDGGIEPVVIRRGALAADSLTSARQIRQPITTESDMRGAFDGITYLKGATVIRMFEHWIGRDVFQRAARRYLAAHAHDTATAANFLAALDAETGRPIGAAFATFLDQPGVPMIDMELRCPADQPVTLGLAQRRFAPATQAASAATWQVPVCVRIAGEREARCTLLSGATGEIALGDRCPQWIIPNAGGVGYYLSRLPAQALARLLDAGWNELSRVERISLVSDVSMLIEGGHTDLGVLLAILPRLGASDDPYLVHIVVERLWRLAALVAGDQREAFARVVRDTVGTHGARLGWVAKPDEPVADAELRGWLMALLAVHGREPVARDQANTLTRQWLADTNAVPESLWVPVLATAVRTNPREAFQALVDRLPAETNRIALTAMYSALREVPDRELQASAFAMVLDGDPIAPEKIGLLRTTSQPVELQLARFEFLRSHADELARRLPRDLLGVLVATVCDANHRDTVAAHLATLATIPEIGERAIKQAVESMDLCIARRAAQEPVLARYLAGR